VNFGRLLEKRGVERVNELRDENKTSPDIQLQMMQYIDVAMRYHDDGAEQGYEYAGNFLQRRLLAIEK